MLETLEKEIYATLLDSLKDQLVFVDANHVIRYMNKTAVAQHKDGEKLIGQSIFQCHSEESRKKIVEAYDVLCKGAEEILISDKKERRIFMRAVRDKDGKIVGYYERYEQ